MGDSTPKVEATLRTPVKKETDAKRFGNGENHRAKVIGKKEVQDVRAEGKCGEFIKLLQDEVAVKGQHKQRILLNLSLDGVKQLDEKTKNVIYEHSLRKIPFLSRGQHDSRAFGYVHTEADGTHWLYAIKTDKAADNVMSAMRDLFITAGELLSAKANIDNKSDDSGNGSDNSPERTGSSQSPSVGKSESTGSQKEETEPKFQTDFLLDFNDVTPTASIQVPEAAPQPVFPTDFSNMDPWSTPTVATSTGQVDKFGVDLFSANTSVTTSPATDPFGCLTIGQTATSQPTPLAPPPHAALPTSIPSTASPQQVQDPFSGLGALSPTSQSNPFDNTTSNWESFEDRFSSLSTMSPQQASGWTSAPQKPLPVLETPKDPFADLQVPLGSKTKAQNDPFWVGNDSLCKDPFDTSHIPPLPLRLTFYEEFNLPYPSQPPPPLPLEISSLPLVPPKIPPRPSPRTSCNASTISGQVSMHENRRPLKKFASQMDGQHWSIHRDPKPSVFRTKVVSSETGPFECPDELFNDPFHGDDPFSG